ncbi:hypothetical protein BV20DRAFT_1037239 [Pilatotrama ljubarskyi]|nr:hypothetical protein BV20DRAFT_1037239 [Pilatotrama ljubarskyi]
MSISEASPQFCQTQSNNEIQEFLQGLKNRFSLLNVPDPEVVVADNCCHVRKAIKNVFPDTHVGLDVWHMLMRYNACILGSSSNHARGEITDDIVSAILKSCADKFNPAVYWPHEEQEKQLDAAFQKWAARGAWSAAAAKVHQEQLKHVKKGCLTRPRSDIPSDGSHIEGSHRGLEMMTTLSHDHIFCRNHRIDMESDDPSPFTLSTFGSHHIRLVDHVAREWNTLQAQADSKHAHLLTGAKILPTFQSVNSGETFGIVRSQFARGYQYFMDVKEEETEDLLDLSAQSPQHARQLLESINIDPALLSQPLPTSARIVPQAQSEQAQDIDDEIVIISHTSMSTAASVVPRGIMTSEHHIEHAPHDTCSPHSDQHNGPESARAIHKPETMPAVIKADDALDSSSATHQLPATVQVMILTPSPSSIRSAAMLPKVEIHSLTLSQRLFSLVTGLNPASFSIEAGDEFFLFMDLRAKHQWASYAMTPQKWVEAASIYDTKLEKLSRQYGRSSWTVWKTPRALMDKLAGDYKAKGSGSEDFWKKHCHAVPLLKGGSDLKKVGPLQRKLNACTQCKTIMWPGPKSSAENHKCSYCSDGVRMNPQISKKMLDGQTITVTEELLPWPQLSGIFENGTIFNPLAFLHTVERMYHQMVACKSSGGEYAMEYLAFAEMLHKRTITVSPPGSSGSINSSSDSSQATLILFRLFDSLTLGLVMCWARPEAIEAPKPSPQSPSRAGPW